MRFRHALLTLAFVIMPVVQADASPEDDKEFQLTAEKTVAAVRACYKFGPSYCLSGLALATDEVNKSFDEKKNGLSKLACDSPLWETTTNRYLVIVKGFGSNVVEVMDKTAQLARTDRSEVGSVQELSLIFDRIMRFGAEMLLATGDIALKSGCRNQADRTYRAVVTSFTGDNMSAYRERARIGIEDVRSSAGILCRTIGYC